jgi:16S rRNA (guanine1207-N2)-methyltransferase
VSPRRRGGGELAPSAAALAALGPYARTTLTVHALGRALPLDVPHDVFASKAIDDGTLLLLRNLPPGAPRSFLDLGCGYGALGLPTAARFPQARALLVDRDLLAVRASAHNARSLALGNVETRSGLGFADLPCGAAPFDWIVCNVPARIGAAAIGHFLEAGRGLLAGGGELRIVVIRDLCATVEAQARDRGLSQLRRIAEGTRHSVYALAPGASGVPLEDLEIYARDETRLAAFGRELRLLRPQDASEDPAHASALQLLLDALPRTEPRRVLCYRCGYGAVPIAARLRYPAAEVVATDRDLLDTAFTALNARTLGLAGPALRIAPAVFPAEALPEGGADLVLGESWAPAGQAVFARELRETQALLAPGGESLVLASERQAREWVAPGAAAVLLRRSGACLLRVTRPRVHRPP